MFISVWKKPLGRALGLASLLKAAHPFQPRANTRIFYKRSLSSLSAISDHDVEHMNLALANARKGFGHTFPNPAVGCVLVRQDNHQVIGAGFHPRAGFPHAEVFALLQATGHLEDGAQAAESVVQAHARKPKNTVPEILELVKQLTEQYASEKGPEELFGSNNFDGFPVTAYVTLEPCCHYGKTPPCAASLVRAKVSRVVVGLRDPNPRVDGGGVSLLQQAGIQVDMMSDSEEEAAIQAHQDCAEIVQDFLKRITTQPDYSHITGAVRRALRSHAGRMKNDNTLFEVEWAGERVAPADGEETDWENLVQNLSFDPSWLERTDHLLWEHELVLLRLNKAAKKKKAVKLLGERIANQLQAHVAQTVGHTVLVYRPNIQPVLDLDKIKGSSA